MISVTVKEDTKKFFKSKIQLTEVLKLGVKWEMMLSSEDE